MGRIQKRKIAQAFPGCSKDSLFRLPGYVSAKGYRIIQLLINYHPDNFFHHNLSMDIYLFGKNGIAIIDL